MGLLKEAHVFICLSDVNTILSFHAPLRLPGDRGLKTLSLLSAQLLWLGSVSRQRGGRLDRSGRGRSHFSPCVWCGGCSSSDSCWGNKYATPSPAVRAEGSILSSLTSQTASLVTRSSESFVELQAASWAVVLASGVSTDAQIALGRHSEVFLLWSFSLMGSCFSESPPVFLSLLSSSCVLH